ncbi:MAG TPA: heat-inducible transcriptional repressor HrcA [Armatimonadota bacterium]|jgi:heat-inducible transcriptional repressor
MNRQEDTFILTERQTAILRAVVEEYIATAQPVSSALIAEHRDVHASPATVRNEMARLEEVGLLLQPHTSAGRIPTDLGYRYYVDHLLTEFQMQRQAPSAHTERHDPGIEATCKLLGELTRYTTLALVAGWQEYRLQHIELAPVGDDQLLIMLVTDNRQVLHSLTTVTDRPAPARLRQLNDLLNKEFAGKLLSGLTEEALARAVAKLPHAPDAFLRSAPQLVRRGLERHHPDTRVYVEGTTHIFDHQDFSDVPKLRALMEALHEESVFERLFARSVPGEITLSIGAENPHPGLEDCAIVFTSYQLSEHSTGRIGVLGPKRMPYRNVIRTVDAVVSNLDRRLETGHSSQ